MDDFNHLFSPGEVIGDAPLFRTAVAVGTVVAVLLILGLIGFLLIDIIMDEIGVPLHAVPGKPDAETAQMSRQANEEEPPPTEWTPEQVSSQFTILTPPDKAVFDAGKPVPFLCYWKAPPRHPNAEPPLNPHLEIDGTQIAWSAVFGKNVWMVRLPLKPGRHTFWAPGIEEVERELFLRDPSAGSETPPPRGGMPVRFHPAADVPDQCTDCHEVRDAPDVIPRKGATVSHYLGIGKAGDHRTCANCHALADFEGTHRHEYELFKDCAICHSLHVSTVPEPGLLAKPKEILCTPCHEAREK